MFVTGHYVSMRLLSHYIVNNMYNVFVHFPVLLR